MKNNKLRFMVLIAVALCILFTASISFADVGNFNDYSSGGGWDSGSDWGSGSDWSSSGGDYYYLGGYDSDDDWDGAAGVIIFVVFAVLIVGAIAAQRRKGTGSAPGKPGVMPSNNTNMISAEITKADPMFSVDKFIGWAKEVFITLQQAWMERSWERIRPFEKEELFRQHEMQLQEYINLGRINVIERININQAYLHKYERDAEYEYLTVYMQVRMIDYIKDEKTEKVLKGNPDQDCFLSYLLTFIRKNGVKTDPANSNRSTVACPHCGAPTKITSAGKCEYCGFIITTGEFDWVLADMTGIKPSTVIDNRGVIIRDGKPGGGDAGQNNTGGPHGGNAGAGTQGSDDVKGSGEDNGRDV